VAVPSQATGSSGSKPSSHEILSAAVVHDSRFSQWQGAGRHHSNTASCCPPSFLQANKSFFSEIIASISDITFSKDGRYILSRDYMTLKLWDLNKESAPVATFHTHEHLRARVSHLNAFGSLF
jgi:hypothetical protein